MLDADWLSPLMCINMGVLFIIIRVVRVWLNIMVGAAGNATNAGRCAN